MYYALAGNPNVAGITVGELAAQTVNVGPDGSFTIAVLPGPGFLGFTTREGYYPAACVKPPDSVLDIVRPKPTRDMLWIAIGGGGITSIDQEPFQGIAFLNVDPKMPPAEQRFDLRPVEPVRGRLLDPDGKPLTGVRVRGLRQRGEVWCPPLQGNTFIASPPHPDRPRRLTFRHDGRALAGTAIVRAGSAQPVDFKLERWGVLTGRLVDENGKPISHVDVNAAGVFDGDRSNAVSVGNVFTDSKGRFQLDGLIPGVPYELYFREFKPNGRSGVFAKEIRAKAGENRNLGDLKLAVKD